MTHDSYPDALIRDILKTTKRIALVGASANEARPSWIVTKYLLDRGYRILPVNPTLEGRTLFGVPVVGTLAGLAEPVDVVEVFRRPEYLPGHAEEILAMAPRPAAVWFQLGIRHDGAAERLARAGIRVVQDRCMMPEHRRLLRVA